MIICRKRQSSIGQSAVELALVVPTFLLLMFAVMDFARLFFIQENIQQAVLAGTRYASTGNHESRTNPATGQPYTRVGSIDYYIDQEASVAVSLGATLSSINISSVYGGAGSAGGPQDIETVTVTATLSLMTPIISNFFPKGQYTFTVNSTVKNEPFPPAETK
jgi:Flp pilus assembly protein TadG